jgi:hypothetical protein
MPGPVVQGVQSAPARAAGQASAPIQAPIPLLAEGTIKLVLMSSGAVLIARLRHTSDRDGQPAFQLLRISKKRERDD